MKFLASILLFSFLSSPLPATGLTLRSGPERVHLLELYTSEGCSSCPPAEAWLNELRNSPLLWKSIVPVTFHVTYWDYLGWRDAFARPEFTQRQSAYASQWNAANVYTPEFVLDGAEWRRGALPTAGPEKPGLLQAQLTSTSLSIKYQPSVQPDIARNLFYLYLRQPAEVDVKAGENAGRKLPHFFIAGENGHAVLSSGAQQSATVALDPNLVKKAAGFVIWVALPQKLEPEQAAGTTLGSHQLFDGLK